MGEALDVQLLGLNDDLPDALGLAEGSGLLQFPLGERAGLSCHGDGPVAQRIVGDFQQKVESTPLENATATLPSSRR